MLLFCTFLAFYGCLIQHISLYNIDMIYINYAWITLISIDCSFEYVNGYVWILLIWVWIFWEGSDDIFQSLIWMEGVLHEIDGLLVTFGCFRVFNRQGRLKQTRLKRHFVSRDGWGRGTGQFFLRDQDIRNWLGLMHPHSDITFQCHPALSFLSYKQHQIPLVGSVNGKEKGNILTGNHVFAIKYRGFP